MRKAWASGLRVGEGEEAVSHQPARSQGTGALVWTYRAAAGPITNKVFDILPSDR